MFPLSGALFSIVVQGIVAVQRSPGIGTPIIVLYKAGETQSHMHFVLAIHYCRPILFLLN
jgi:hypothetical protein